MNVFIQRIATGLYMKTETEWVNSREDARSFASWDESIRFCVAHGMRDVQIVAGLEHPPIDVSLKAAQSEIERLREASEKLRERNERLMSEVWRLNWQKNTRIRGEPVRKDATGRCKSDDGI